MMRAGMDQDQLRVLAVEMETLDLQIAAAVAYMCMDKLRSLAKQGMVPGAAKHGRAWVFIKSDLMQWIREGSPHSKKATGGEPWLSENVMDVGMLTSQSKELAEYADLLASKQRNKIVPLRKSGTMNLNATSGVA